MCFSVVSEHIRRQNVAENEMNSNEKIAQRAEKEKMYVQSYSMELAGRTLTVDIDRVAKQANGAAFMHYGDTVVLSTATASESQEKELIFYPLSVEYEEKMYAVGKSPGWI